MKSEPGKYEEVEKNRFKNMTACEKLNLSLLLNKSARELKKAALEQLHPELTKEQIEVKVRESFLYARS